MCNARLNILTHATFWRLVLRRFWDGVSNIWRREAAAPCDASAFKRAVQQHKRSKLNELPSQLPNLPHQATWSYQYSTDFPLSEIFQYRTRSRPDAGGIVSRLGSLGGEKFPRCLTVWSLLSPISCFDILHTLTSFKVSCLSSLLHPILCCLLSSTFFRFLLHFYFLHQQTTLSRAGPQPTGNITIIYH